jgi:hypothetical protein
MAATQGAMHGMQQCIEREVVALGKFLDLDNAKDGFLSVEFWRGLALI